MPFQPLVVRFLQKRSSAIEPLPMWNLKAAPWGRSPRGTDKDVLVIRLRLLTCATAAAVLASVAPASASMLVDRNTNHQSLRVNKAGIAQVTFRGGNHGGSHINKVIYWGAKNGDLQFK